MLAASSLLGPSPARCFGVPSFLVNLSLGTLDPWDSDDGPPFSMLCTAVVFVPEFIIIPVFVSVLPLPFTEHFVSLP